MSRIANSPIDVPSGVEVSIGAENISCKGPKGSLSLTINRMIQVQQDGSELKISTEVKTSEANALAGTTRSLIANMVTGVTTGFERRLELVGVGYRAQAQGKKLNLQLGFSHPVEYQVPDGVEAITPTQTEIVLTGSDKQLIGQVCAEIRAYRPPEPYKGKGVRYAGERVRRKEAKKKK